MESFCLLSQFSEPEATLEGDQGKPVAAGGAGI